MMVTVVWMKTYILIRSRHTGKSHYGLPAVLSKFHLFTADIYESGLVFLQKPRRVEVKIKLSSSVGTDVFQEIT